MAKSKDKPYGGPRGGEDDRSGWQGGQDTGRDRYEDDRIYGARGGAGGPEWDRPSQASGMGGAHDGGYGEGGLGEGGLGQRGGSSGTGYGYGYGGGRGYGPGGLTGAYGAGGPEHGRGSGMGPGGMGEGGSGRSGQDARRDQGGGDRSGSYGQGGYGEGYGERGYGEGSYGQGGFGQRGMGERGYGHRSGGGGAGERGFLERAGDEVSSWFGDEDARQRREADHRGKGPRGYRRSDDRIREDVNDRLSDDPHVDASDIEVTVENGEVTLTGEVSSRQEKRSAEDCVERVSGVGHVQNNLRVRSATGATSQAAQPGQTGRAPGSGSQL